MHSRLELITVHRVKALGPWLGEARYAWLSIVVIVVALAIALRPQTSELVVRLTGLVLQLLGIATVIWGLSKTRALFGHPSLASKTRAWLRQFPLLRRSVVMAASGGALAATSGKARAYVTHGPAANPTFETRLDAIEKNVTAIHERISQTQRKMDEERREAANAIMREKQERQVEDHATQAKLEATGTGGIHISAIGASWLFVGVILSTASVEIAKLLK